MAFTNSNDYLTGRKPAVYGAGDEVVCVRAEVALVAGDMTLNNVGAVLPLPAGCVPVDVKFDTDDLDSNGAPAVAMSLGVLNAAGNDISTATADGGAAWGTAITTSQAGGQAQVLSKALARVQATQSDRLVGIKFTTAPATAAAGTIGIQMSYRAV